MEPLTLGALAALVVKVTSVLKALGKDTNLVVTQAATWAVSVAVFFLAASADVTAGLVLYDGVAPLGELDGPSVVLAGLAFGSLGSFGYDVRKSIDANDSAREPKLLRRP